jgi:hypothetical protein
MSVFLGFMNYMRLMVPAVAIPVRALRALDAENDDELSLSTDTTRHGKRLRNKYRTMPFKYPVLRLP